MKIHVEVDITPEELRRLYGVPDIARLQSAVMEQINEKLSNADIEGLSQFIKPVMSEGLKAVDAYQKFLGGIIKFVPGVVDKDKGDDDEAHGDSKSRVKAKAE